MENASKALEIAAGVMLGVLLFAMVTYFFTSISSWPEQEDNTKESQQLAQFNLEFEIYDKKGMYGTDVISCLTKAVNNNEKYYSVNNDYSEGVYLPGRKYGKEFWVNVYVNLKSDLTEELIVYHMKIASNSIYKQELQFGNECNTYKLGDIGFKFDTSDNGAKTYSHFNKDTSLGNRTVKISAANHPAGRPATEFINISSKANNRNGYNACLYYEKTDEDGEVFMDMETETPLQILLDTCSSNIKQIVKNKSNNKESLEAWSSAEWRTALYDFKTRKFRCNEIKYSEVTGRVNEIYFSEI